MAVEFKDFSIQVVKAIDEAAIAWLYESAGEVEAQVKRNTPVDTGQLKANWKNIVNEEKLEAVVGNPLENAIWTEFGTGEYALEGNGRKGGWKYQDERGKWHFTMGKKPQRSLHNAFEKLKPKLIKRANEIFKENIK